MKAIESRLRPLGWYVEQQRLFLDAIQPLTQMKVHIYSLYLPTVIVDSDGNLVRAAYPPEAQELIEKIDATIQQLADTWVKQ